MPPRGRISAERKQLPPSTPGVVRTIRFPGGKEDCPDVHRWGRVPQRKGTAGRKARLTRTKSNRVSRELCRSSRWGFFKKQKHSALGEKPHVPTAPAHAVSMFATCLNNATRISLSSEYFVLFWMIMSTALSTVSMTTFFGLIRVSMLFFLPEAS